MISKIKKGTTCRWKVLMIMSYLDHFPDFSTVILLLVPVEQARKFLLLDKELKGKIVLQDFMEYQDSSQL